MKPPRMALLTGSGFSIPAGMPCTEYLTETILNEEVVKKTFLDKAVKLGRPKEAFKNIDKFPEFVHYFLSNIYDYSDSNNVNRCYKIVNQYEKRHIVNYEDLYFMFNQMYEHLYGGFNLYGKQLVDETNFEDFVYRCNRETGLPIDCTYFLRRCSKYIFKTIQCEIQKVSPNLDTYIGFMEIIKNGFEDSLSIFTLNHDTVIEKLLQNSEIQFCDGFYENDKGAKFWDSGLSEMDACRVRLLKLHGSIDWSVDRDSGVLTKKINKKEIKCDYVKEEIDFNAVFLVGTHNKINSYLEHEYWELYQRFKKYILECDILIIIGYSFGDAGINQRVIEWLEKNNEKKKMIIIDKKEKYIFIEELPHILRNTGKFPILGEKYKDKVMYFGEGFERFTAEMFNKFISN